LLPRHVDGSSTLDFAHVREGVCVRVERHGQHVTTYKHKSHTFYVLEGVVKDSGEVDIEEAA